MRGAARQETADCPVMMRRPGPIRPCSKRVPNVLDGQVIEAIVILEHVRNTEVTPMPTRPYTASKVRDPGRERFSIIFATRCGWTLPESLAVVFGGVWVLPILLRLISLSSS
jgi:hypothetical protein